MFDKLFCKHEYYADSHTHGDQIIYFNFKRTFIKCAKCGKTKLIEPLIEKGERIKGGK